THSGFNGEININDSYGQLSAEGLVEIGDKISQFNFRAKAEGIRPDKLNLSTKYPDSELSFSLDANFTGNTAENAEGSICIRDFLFQVPEDSLLMDSIFIRASGVGKNRRIDLRSDVVNMKLSGAYSYRQLIPVVTQGIHRYFPAIVPPPEKTITDENDFYLDINIDNTEKLSKIFRLPVTVFSQSRLYGQYSHTGGMFHFQASLPGFSWGSMKMEDVSLSINNAHQTLNVDVKGIRYGKSNVKTDFDLYLSAENNVLKSMLKWKNREESLYQGQLSAIVGFWPAERAESPGRIEIDLLPAQLTFSDTVWTVHQAGIRIMGKKIEINHLDVDHSDQFVKINGIISDNSADSLKVELNKVNLAYLFDALDIAGLDFGGVATGQAVLNDLYYSRKLTTNLDVKNFSFNNAPMGDLKLNGFWDNDHQGVSMIGNAYTDDTTQIDIYGMIYPGKEELSIHFDALNANAAFLRKYLDKVTSGFSGKIVGDIHLYGNFKDVNVGGTVFVRDGSFGIDFLNTVYTFSDTVYLNENNIVLKNTALYDKWRNRAVVNGIVEHRHFREFLYRADIQADNFHVFNATEKQNPAFSGTGFGTGNIKIHGNDKDGEVNIDVNLRTDRNTKISLNFKEKAKVEEYNFITFVSKKETDREERNPLPKYILPDIAPSSTEIKLNLILDVTPDAMLELYIDPVSGDKLKAWGRGNLQILYGTKSAPRIYGNYALERGTYNFSLQQLIQKDFRIKEGSTIGFHGDPYLADLNVDAIYSLSANLGDLDYAFSLEQATPMSSVTVNCLLNITGELQHPTIKFDIALPNSSDELERQVKSIVGTEEMMNRQIIYLLALGRFYTENNIASQKSNNNDFANVASSTLSNQLNNLMGSLNENFQIGTNIRTNNYEEYTDTEVKVLLSSQLLNNRLLINGNLGYKDNSTSQTSFVGDFDLEYKLTPSGNFRLKAYNHYNDKYYYVKSALTTQGVGILFRRDFDDLYELMNKRVEK
ncbi:MAG: translocation/assembly module TamB, partial [Dysgonamonadaceae bacterium]|nr:translocation/assembly module TamB [Dysgonamonadaceae bacterium]